MNIFFPRIDGEILDGNVESVSDEESMKGLVRIKRNNKRAETRGRREVLEA